MPKAETIEQCIIDTNAVKQQAVTDIKLTLVLKNELHLNID
jgi:hypothetical protein